MKNLKELCLKVQSNALKQGFFFRLNACQEHFLEFGGCNKKPAERQYDNFCWECHDDPNSEFYNLKPWE